MATSPLHGALREEPGGSCLLELRGVSFGYGDLRVLNGVDLEVAPGELVGICGENGSGKSTLVRCIAGDLTPEAGEVLIDGVRVRGYASAAACGLAVVWQDLAFCDNLDVAANFFLGRERGGWLVSDRRASIAARSILSSYGIDVGDDRSIRSLSGGQRQLVAVARAMQDEPRLLVLDEPAASLGVQETRQVEELIGKLKSGGTTILLVSHDVDQVFRLADRIVVLRRGSIVADLPPSETHPDDVSAIMSGHAPDATARRQLSRLQDLVDQLASARPTSSLPLIVSALGSALRTEQLCIHLLEDRGLCLVASSGLPPDLLAAWSTLPVGPDGGPMGVAVSSGTVVVDEDVGRSPAWSPFSQLASRAGIRSSWSVPLVGSRGLIGAITGCQPVVGRPHRDQMDLVSIYAGYAGGAIERDRLFGEVTARNRVLETIREVLETLAGPEPVSSGVLLALESLWRGLGATEVELWEQPRDGPLRCMAYVGTDGLGRPDPPGRDGAAALGVLGRAPQPGSPAVFDHGENLDAISTAVDAPRGRVGLVARWSGTAAPEGAAALLVDAANSVRLALEREEAEQAHQHAAALMRSHKIQRDFLSRLSHELRTPLTAIRGFASSLLAPDVTWDDDSKQRFLSRIAEESARLGRLVGDLLDFSAIESGLLRLQPDWCDLSLILEAAVSCLPDEWSKAVSMRGPVAAGPVWGDHDRLEQVFVNLLENAFRHNAPGVSVAIEVLPAGGDMVAVRVSDDGLGIPEELRSGLFDLPASDGSSPRRPGMGLSIAAGIVRAHGGRMSLEPSAPGASFVVTLPTEAPGEALP